MDAEREAGPAVGETHCPEPMVDGDVEIQVCYEHHKFAVYQELVLDTSLAVGVVSQTYGPNLVVDVERLIC